MDTGWQVRLRIAAARAPLAELLPPSDALQERMRRLEAQRAWALSQFVFAPKIEVQTSTIEAEGLLPAEIRTTMTELRTSVVTKIRSWLMHPLVVWEP